MVSWSLPHKTCGAAVKPDISGSFEHVFAGVGNLLSLEQGRAASRFAAEHEFASDHGEKRSVATNDKQHLIVGSMTSNWYTVNRAFGSCLCMSC